MGYSTVSDIGSGLGTWGRRRQGLLCLVVWLNFKVHSPTNSRQPTLLPTYLASAEFILGTNSNGSNCHRSSRHCQEGRQDICEVWLEMLSLRQRC